MRECRSLENGQVQTINLLPNLSFPKEKSCGLVPTQVQILSLAFILRLGSLDKELEQSVERRLGI